MYHMCSLAVDSHLFFVSSFVDVGVVCGEDNEVYEETGEASAAVTLVRSLLAIKHSMMHVYHATGGEQGM